MRAPLWGVGLGTLVMVSVVAPALIGLSVPRLSASLLALPGDPTRFSITHSKQVSDNGLTRLIESREQALSWAEDPRYYRDIGLAALRLAGRKGRQTDEGQVLLEKAERALLGGLAIAPANPYAWMNLARARYYLGRDLDSTMQAYQNSILTGPYSTNLTASRIRFGITLWPKLGADQRELVIRQIRLLAGSPDQIDLEDLARLTDSKRAYTIVVLALIDDQESLAAFKQARRRLNVTPQIS